MSEKGASVEDIHKAILDFLSIFVILFDNDWDYTLSKITNDFCGKTDATFLHPNVADESNNWVNRGTLLSSFRKLLDVLSIKEIHLLSMAVNPGVSSSRAASMSEVTEGYWRDLATSQQATIASLVRQLADAGRSVATPVKDNVRAAAKTA